MTSPLDQAVARLDDYVRSVTPAADAEEYEQDLFSRALERRAPELEFRAGVGATLREMAARGTIDLWLTAEGARRVMASGLRVVHFELDLEHPSLPELSGEFDILITKVPIDLTGIRRLDAEIASPTGERLKVMPDIAFDPNDGAVFACCEADLARVAAASETVTRVWAVDDSGRRLVCEIKGG